MAQRQDHFLPRGGLDLVTSALAIPKGLMIAVKNYESSEGGYRRVGGYERYDGRPAPSDATFWIQNFDGASSLAAKGDTIEGGTSGETAVVLDTGADVENPVVLSGSTGTGDAAGYYVLVEVDGADREDLEFEDGEDLEVGGSVRGQADGTPRKEAAESFVEADTYRAAAAERRRALIQPVPGSGPVRGVWQYKGDLYAFRDNSAGSALDMFKSSPDGWQLITVNRRVEISAISAIPPVGAEIRSLQIGREGTLGTGILTRLRITSGHVNIGTGVGQLTFRATSGTIGAGERLEYRRRPEDSWTRFAENITRPPVDQTIGAGGRYEFRNHNFGGQADQRKMYFVSGTGPAFEWDGTTLSPIETGRSGDTPTHLAIQSNHLLLAYRGGSIQNSATGDPLDWTAGNGAAEIATGQEIHGMLEGVGLGNTVIMGANAIQALYGADKESWELRTHSGDDSGAIEWSAQMMGAPVYMDNRGLRSLETTDRYGNFLIGTLTYLVQPWLDAQRRVGAVPTASMRLRARDLYRVFFGKVGLSVYFGRRKPECAIVEYDHAVRCTGTIEEENGEERVFFGSDDGWVFEVENGRSFDGEEIEAFVRLPYNHAGSPSHEIRFHKANIHVAADARATIRVGAGFDYGAGEGFLGPEAALQGGEGVWNEATWGDFHWDSEESSVARFHFSGIGANVSLLIYSRSAKELPHTLTGITMHFSNRRLRR